MSVEILDVVALSPLQRGLYSVSAMSGEVDPYLVTFSVRIEDLTDLSTLRTAFDGLLERYPHLGGAVLTDGLPHPVLVMTTAGRIGWRELDLRSAADPEAAARQLYWDEGRRRLDLDSGPLFRVVAARVGEHAYELVCTAHHIIIDGWSIPLLFADLIALHSDTAGTLPPAPPLRAHAAWLAARDTEASIRVWQQALADLAPMAMLAAPAPADIPALGEACLDRAATEQVTAWARSHGLTLNTVLQMAWARILSGFTGRDDVVFGQTTSGRDASLPDADRLVGALVTTIPVRVRLDQRAPAEIGAALQREVAHLRSHEYLGIADITRHTGGNQLFDTLLVFENTPMGAVTADMPMGRGARLQPRRVDSPSHYPIAVVPVVEHGELITRVEVRPDLTARFDPDRLAHRMLAVVERIVAAPNAADMSLLLADEPAELTSAVPQAISDIDADSNNSDGAPRVESSEEPAESAVLAGTASPFTSAAGGLGVSDVLLAAAGRAGDAVAVVDGAGEQTFAEFATAVRTLAAQLRESGLRPGAAVAVVLPRDRRVLHAPFAIAHAGGLCVHVDPGTPPDRLAYLLETSGARLVLGDEVLMDVLVQVRAQGVECVHGVTTGDGALHLLGFGADDLSSAGGNALRTSGADAAGPCGDGVKPGGSLGTAVPVGSANGEVAQPGSGARITPDAAAVATPDTPLYVIFTSGTTGRPKGVVVPHRALLNHWANHERRIFAPAAARVGRQLRIGHGWSTGFDAAWQPTVALLSGHTVVMLGEQARTDAEQIAAAISGQGIDIFDTSPSMLARLIAFGLFTERDGVEHCALAVLALGGEAIDPDTWRRLQRLPETRVINFYGPTEATVEALMADVHDHVSPTIGRTFDGMTAEVLDHRLRPVPPGGLGELYLSGPQLALGYLGRPGTTAAAFVAGPAGRRYRTGDLVRRAVDGTVIYEGRIDSQVKINGYRVEPDEAAVVLRELDGVEHAAVLAYIDNGRTRLGALVVSEVPVPRLRAGLARRLPRFLVPTRIVPVAEIPLNRNDKLDVHAATALLTAPVAGARGTEPATGTERTLLGVLSALSAANAGAGPGITDSLVDLGIDSIGVIDLVSRLRGAGFRVAARDVLAAGDLRELAARLDELAAGGADEEAAPVTPAGTVLPLTALAREIIANGNYRYLAQSQVISLPADATPEAVADRLAALATAHPALRSRLIWSTASDTVADRGSTSIAAEASRLAIDVPRSAGDTSVQSGDSLIPAGESLVLAGGRPGSAPGAGGGATPGGSGTPALLVEESPEAGSWLRVGSGTGSSATHLAETVARLDPEAGRMVAATILEGPQPRLLLSVHHLAVDVVSWLIVADDLRRMAQGEVPPNETPYGETDSVAITSGAEVLGTPLAGRLTDPATDRAGNVVQRVVEFGPERTAELLARCAEAEVGLEDALILACAGTFPDIADAADRIAITRESHGRPAEDDSRRVGWFTVEETVLVPVEEAGAWTPADVLPDLSDRTFAARGQLRLNHLGRFDVLQFGSGPWSPVPLAEFTSEFGVAAHPDLPLRFTVDVTTAVVPRADGPSLVAQFDVNAAVLDESAVDARVARWNAVLSGFAGMASDLAGVAADSRASEESRVG
ncbi:AMP-binding protein [Nocardia sp. NPDC088792]|uniref:non-ribosomal peptide synthetase n=1 Tax=Nocardia sp. NPDC088792 TaxID=3364332 RepID=UPI00380C6E2C